MTDAENKILGEMNGVTEVAPFTKKVKVKSFDLLKYSNDKDIEEALGENHLFSQGEVYSIIGSLISKQANGEEGSLLNDGNWNLFYTEKLVLAVGWGSGRGGWVVVCWRRVDAWLDGARVFSPETGA